MRQSTVKLTTAAVCTALAVIMCAMTAYLPLSFMPLYLAAFCIFSACKRGGIFYGILCALASIGLMFVMTGLNVKWLLFVIMFAPYGILAYFIDKLTYFKVKTALLRVLIVLLYFNATLGAIYAIAVNVAAVGLEGVNIAEWSNVVGGYAVLAVIASAVLLPLDFIFSALSAVVLKRIPGMREKSPPPTGDEPSADKTGDGKKYDDVFGYEIPEKSDNDDNDPKKE